MNKLTEKIAVSDRGVPIPSTAGSVAAYLTYWLENVAIHPLRENIPRYTVCVHRYLMPGLGKKKLAKDVRPWLNQLRAHVRLRLQRDAIDALGTALDGPTNTETARSDGDEPPPCASLAR
nr:hypothetical protein [Streptomyces buecherae]